MCCIVRLACLTFLLAPLPVAAQTGQGAPRVAVELTSGYAGFVDDATIDHAVIEGTVRFHVSPRLSVGPEVTYMVGPRDDRDWFLMGNVYFDFRSPAGRRLRVAPFVVGGGGLMRHFDRFGPITYASSEGAFTAGGGVRLHLTDRVYVAPEYRIGWELHFRLTATVGVVLP
jgi:hypothetical protein